MNPQYENAGEVVRIGSGMSWQGVTGFLLLLTALRVGGASAQIPGVQISGFGDVYYTAPQDSGSTPFSIGQAELDVRARIRENIQVSAALAYNADGHLFESGEFFVEFLLFGVEENHLRPVRGITHSGILAGQFDVPFGIDWQVYASIDRKLVSVPLVVENTHGLWNDTGIQVHAANGRFNAVAFAVNGFGYDEARMKYAGGGRLGLVVLPGLELGGSWAGFVRDGGGLDQRLVGADIQAEWRSLNLRAEYIARETGIDGDAITTDSGYYVEGQYAFGRFFGVARQDFFSPGGPVESETRTSLGAGWIITDGCETRIEHQMREDDDDMTWLQLAVEF